MADILLIEDDEQVRSIVRSMLERLGHEVAVARDGGEGLELFRAEPTRLVVTDLLMPGKEGLETIRELRKVEPEVRILAISGGGRTLAAESILELAQSLGAHSVLEKPFDLAALGSALEELAA